MTTFGSTILIAAILAAPKSATKKSATPADQLSKTVRQAAELTKQKEYSRILVIVRHLTRSKTERPDSKLIKSTRDSIAKSLQSEKVKFVISEKVDKRLTEKKSASAISFKQFRDFESLEEFDIILTADIRKRSKTSSVRLGLMDFRKRLMNKSIPLSGVAARARSKSSKSNIAKSSKTNGASGVPTVGTGKATGNVNRNRLPHFNQRILQFARNQLGRKVGNGECWTLGNEALKFAGAQPAIGYTFGREVNMRQLLPGDILQFRSAKFQNGNSFIFLGTPDHTGVVESIQGTRVTILHQNAGGRFVTRMTIDFSTMTSGSVTGFRAISKGVLGITN